MKRYFEYNRTNNDEQFNSIVDGALDLARQTYEGKKSADYSEKNTIVIDAMLKKSIEGTRYEAQFEAEGRSVFKNPAVRKNNNFRENFNAVIAQIVTAIVPEVVND